MVLQNIHNLICLFAFLYCTSISYCKASAFCPMFNKRIIYIYIIPQSNFVSYVAPRIEKANFPLVLYVFEVEESISDIFTELSCSRDLDILGQLPVLLPIFALISDTVALVKSISAISTFFLFSRSRNPFLAVSQSYLVRMISKIQVNFRFRRFSRVLMIESYGIS